MRLGVDASRAVGRRTGVGRYVEYLLREWSRTDLPFTGIHVFSHSETGVVPASDERFVEVVLPGRPGIRWQQLRLARAARELDVLFAPYSVPFGLRPPSVVANLGIYEGALALSGVRARLRSRHFAHSARAAASVVANSEATKRDLVRHYGVDERKIVVVWPGVDDRFHPSASADDREEAGAVAAGVVGEPGPFLLFAGKLSERRNVPALVEAFRSVRDAVPGTRLLLVGPDTTGNAAAWDLAREPGVTHLEHVDQDTLAHLYRAAAAFVLPTQAEGFSFTILEALASGAPVVTLRHDALVEAGLDRAVLALPGPEPAALAEALVEVLTRPATAERLRADGVAATRDFSWAHNARATMDVIRAVIENRAS